MGKGQKSKHNPWILISFHSLITEIQKLKNLSRFPLFPSLLTTKSNFGNPFFPEQEKDEERVQSAICSLFTFGLTSVRRPCFEFNRVLGAPYSPISSLASQKKTMGEMQGPPPGSSESKRYPRAMYKKTTTEVGPPSPLFLSC